jgi:hypothetical protein
MRAAPAHRAGLAVCMATCLCATALACTPVAGASGAGAPRARAARTISLNETGRLHLTSKKGFTLNEEGAASGTIRGKIYLHLKIVSTNHVTAEVSIYPSSGSLTGNASAGYHVRGGTASFDGTMSVTRGSGGYRSARASGLGFAGTISRDNDAVTVHLTGSLSV